MNRQAVALAADSAVTITGADAGVKIFASANKIFALSKYEPVGLMIYGNATVVGMPWETVVKSYRAELADRCFATLDEQSEHFVRWLGSSPMFSDEMKRGFVLGHVRGLLVAIRELIIDQVAEHIDEHGSVDEAGVASITEDVIKRMSEVAKNADKRPLRPNFASDLRKAFDSAIRTLVKEIFEELPLTTALKRALNGVALAPFTRSMRPGASGIVIAGFGRNEYLPCLRAYEIEGVALDQTIFNPIRDATITTSAQSSAYVSGFAQSDVISMFMEGVAPEYQAFVDGYIDTIISRFAEALGDESDNPELRAKLEGARDDLLGSFAQELSEQRYNEYVEPVLDVVQSLPIDELAALAESLVNLTSLKRRISRDDETVGGPVDVAVISKGDGLIWVHRKHYFDAAKNPQFFANYYRGGSDAGREG